MKAKVLLEKFGKTIEELAGDGCDHCALHDFAREALPRLECAKCGLPLNETTAERDEPIGHANVFDEDEQLYRSPVLSCDNCGILTAYLPTQVQYNGNHDTYYTGGPRYIVDEQFDVALEELRTKVTELINQFLTRLPKEPRLRAEDLSTWIKYATEASLAKMLFDGGLKR